MSSLAKLIDVNKVYFSQSGECHALRNIQFEVGQGEMLAIVGASGSGKSTLMNILGFLDRPSTGRYYFNDQDVSSLTDVNLAKIRNHKIGFVFQSFFLLPRLTVLQNVMLPLFYRDIHSSIAKEKALYFLEKVKMASFALQKPNQLSGGQQQRVAIARALVGDAEIILADEPTGALDSKTGQEVLDLFHSLNENEGRTIVIITHDKHVSHQCQRVVTLKDGMIQQEEMHEVS